MRLLQAAAGGICRQSVRDYAFKSNLKIKWVRPEKIRCFKPEKSGDQAKLPTLQPGALLLKYDNSKELQSASPEVQSLFKLENSPSRRTTEYYQDQFIKEVQRHPLDYGSMEAKLAKMTATIRRLQEHMERFPRDVKVKVTLKEMIDKRKKFLKYLRRWDYRRFEWMLEKLDMIYKPPPALFHWITRKESLQKLTDKHCENVKQERLQALREQFEAQQIPFLKDAIKTMEASLKTQKELELEEIVTQEMIDEYKAELKALEELKAAKESANIQQQGNE